MSERAYVVATVRPWNIEAFNSIIRHYPGVWHLITAPQDLTQAEIGKLRPRYIFFPHWNHIVPKAILEMSECVCFHETDVPYGRGGSPVQNLIVRGHDATKITALRMVDEVDAGPVYLKRDLSLNGLAEEIFVRSSLVVAGMIGEIVANEPTPLPQEGLPVDFQRRKPEQSEIPGDVRGIGEMFDHLRMLDAAEYPRAFIEHGGFRYEFSRPALRTGAIEADVRITKAAPRGIN